MRYLCLFIPIILLCCNIPFVSYATTFTYTADVLPWHDGWKEESGNTGYGNIIDDGERTVFHINDTGGSFLFASRAWDSYPSNWYYTATFVVKSLHCSSSLGAYFGLQADHSDGKQYHVFYALYPNRLSPFQNAAPDYSLNAAVYNTYTVVLNNGISSVYINGGLAFSHPANVGLYTSLRSGVEFGAGSTLATGESYWDYVSATQSIEPIPEPSTVLLLTTGLAGIGSYSIFRRRKRV